MLVILTALAILPADFTDHELARHQTWLGMRVRQYELLIQKIQRDVDRLHMEMPPGSSLLPLFHANLNYLDELRVKLRQAHDAELHGPPFASAIWRVWAAPKK